MDDTYTLELLSIPAMADSAYLDRLAEIVYDLDGLVDPLLALNEDGSVSASFAVRAASPMEAMEQTKEALALLGRAIMAAEPLREPTEEEAAQGEAVVRMALNPVTEREPEAALA